MSSTRRTEPIYAVIPPLVEKSPPMMLYIVFGVGRRVCLKKGVAMQDGQEQYKNRSGSIVKFSQEL